VVTSIGGSADVEDVTAVCVQDRSLPLACVASNGRVRSPGGKPKGCPLRPGATGEGKTGRVNVSEPLMMPRHGNSLRRVVMAGMIRSGPLRIGRRRPRTLLRSCGHRCSRGTGGTRPGRVSCVWNVETPSGPLHCWCGGRPTVRDAESRGGNRTPKKRMPVAERQQESGTSDRRSLQPVGSRITGRIPGLVPGRESGLTCGG
jgi:hypothetical protein